MGRHKRGSANNAGCDLNMTPMIDVVFQLIIFFVVTLKMTKDINEEIVLEDGKHGPIIKEMPPQTMEIEIDKRGRISIHNAQMTPGQLRAILVNRVNRFHSANFPLLIRADRNTRHEKVKEVMDICTGAGVWKLSFVAIQEHKTKKKK
jgi:biopolymer transport protein ExbD